MTEERRELSVPPDVEMQGGSEILRLFVCGGALSVAMQRAFDEPEMWGQLLAELAIQVAQVYERETPLDAAEALAEIRAALNAAFDRIEAEHGSALN